jgi:hypothetical protein
MSQIEMYPVSCKFQLEFHRSWSTAFDTDAHMFWSTCHLSLSSSTTQHIIISQYLLHYEGRAIAHRLPTKAAWVQSQVKSCGICGGSSGIGNVICKYFSLPANSHSTRCSTPVIIYDPGLMHRPDSGQCTKWIQSHPTPRKWNKKITSLQQFLLLSLPHMHKKTNT